MAARLPGKTVFLYLGRGNNYEGLFLGEKNIPSKYRIRDRFIEFCRKYIQGSILHGITIVKNDRLIKMSLTKKSSICEFYIFWKGRESYFAFYEKSENNKRVFRSWSGWEESYEELSVEDIFYNLDVGKIKGEKEAKGRFDENMYIANLEKNVDVQSFPKRKKKFFQRKLKNIEEDLKKVKKWRDLKELIEFPDFEIPMEYEFKLVGLKFKIDSSENQYKRRDRFYKKIKSFKKAEVILQKRLEDTSVELKKWINGDVFVVKGLGKTIEPVWKTAKLEKSTREIGVNKKILSIGSNIQLAVGLDSKSNNWLKNNWANKDDFWFHIDGEASCHIFLKNPNDISLNSNILQLIGSALRSYSKFSSDQIPVVFTQVKNLKSVKGSPGKVTIKKEKRIDVYYLENWKERISIISSS